MSPDDLSKHRKHGFAIFSKGDAMPAAEEYFITELIFQSSDHSGDTGLRIIQGFSCSTEASGLGSLKNSLALSDLHTFSLYMIIIMANMIN